MLKNPPPLTFEINPDKSEIIWALNSTIKVKICGEDLYVWWNSVTQDLSLKPIIISDPCAFTFFSIDYVFFNLYLFKVSSKFFFLLFGDLSNIDLFFTFLSSLSIPKPDLGIIWNKNVCKSYSSAYINNFFTLNTYRYSICSHWLFNCKKEIKKLRQVLLP